MIKDGKEVPLPKKRITYELFCPNVNCENHIEKVPYLVPDYSLEETLGQVNCACGHAFILPEKSTS